MGTKNLILHPLSNGIYAMEEGDKEYGVFISRTREILILLPSKTFTKENQQKVQELAASGNMIVRNSKFRDRFALSIINGLPSMEYVDKEDKVYQLCIETVDNKDYICTRDGEIFPGVPEDYPDIPKISNPEGKKYMLTEYTKEYNGHTLYRIRAIKDFSGVRAGELGGYVAGEHNLSQYGNCWIRHNAIVYENAIVQDNARVSDLSVVCGNAHVTGGSSVSNAAHISGYARLSCRY